MQITVVEHPLIKHKLSKMRDINSTSRDFREWLDEIAMLMTYEVTRDLELDEMPVQTPICETTGYKLHNNIVVVPILRAGLGLLSGVLRMIPNAHVGHIGLYRDEKTLEPHEYYCKIPPDKDPITIVVDPMLATGGSAEAAITMLKKRGLNNIRFMCLVAAPEGVEVLNKAHPDVKVYTGASVMPVTVFSARNEYGYEAGLGPLLYGNCSRGKQAQHLFAPQCRRRNCKKQADCGYGLQRYAFGA